MDLASPLLVEYIGIDGQLKKADLAEGLPADLGLWEADQPRRFFRTLNVDGRQIIEQVNPAGAASSPAAAA